ncbi:MAG TPA: hypothetical protein VMV01_07580 [Planctomycetota bacterium]|nr:hypothetical protein [Planctomycetota bacterium]
MRLLSLICTAAAALALLTASASSQTTFDTVSGKSYSGKVLSDDGSTVEIETAGGAKVKVPYDALTPKTQYQLKKARTGDDAKSQVALAEWCVTKTLYEEARTAFRKALAADATMADEINAKVVVARKTAADELLARGKSLKASGNLKESRRVLSLLVNELPLEEAATEARTLLADDATQRKQTSLSAKPVAAAKGGGAGGDDVPLRANGEPFSDATRKLFQPVIDSYRKMLDETQDGLRNGGSSGIKDFEQALKEGDKIRKTLEKVRPQGSDEEIGEALTLADSKLEEADVDVRINLVDCYLMRTSYNQASDVVKQGLVQYPKNEQLRQQMNRVTSASADGIGGDWVIVGGRR